MMPAKLKEACFLIVSVPTPINHDKTPDLTPVTSATRTIGQNLSKGSIVVYESTVYPGVTEDVCIPILEEESGLTHGVHLLLDTRLSELIQEIRSIHLKPLPKSSHHQFQKYLDEIGKVYEIVVKAGVHKAPSIKVAEAAKVVEN